MHKCLFWISDYCEFICWNSCSTFSDMFEDMKLFIIQLLMMKLHVHNMWKWVCCELCSNCWIVLCCCWFVVEFMFNWCCCWWFITWVFIIMGLWCELSCGWWFLWKWVDLVNHVEMTFVFMFNVFFKALLSLWTCKQSLETYLGVGRSKLGILGEKW